MSMIYRCDVCGTEKQYLSDSWSEIDLTTPESKYPIYLHHCLGCRSDKREWKAQEASS